MRGPASTDDHSVYGRLSTPWYAELTGVQTITASIKVSANQAIKYGGSAKTLEVKDDVVNEVVQYVTRLVAIAQTYGYASQQQDLDSKGSTLPLPLVVKILESSRKDEMHVHGSYQLRHEPDDALSVAKMIKEFVLEQDRNAVKVSYHPSWFSLEGLHDDDDDFSSADAAGEDKDKEVEGNENGEDSWDTDEYLESEDEQDEDEYDYEEEESVS